MEEVELHQLERSYKELPASYPERAHSASLGRSVLEAR